MDNQKALENLKRIKALDEQIGSISHDVNLMRTGTWEAVKRIRKMSDLMTERQCLLDETIKLLGV
jgi:hypothetical protein